MKNKTMVVLSVLFLSVLMMLISCEKQKTEWKGTIKEEGGITIVKNPKEPLLDEAPFDLIEDLTIRDRGGDERYVFQEIWHVAVDDDENIYIPDSRAANIKVFDRNGKYLRTIGRGGQGPGELGYPFGIQITPNKELVINDRRQARLHYFTLDGEFLRQYSTSKLGRFLLPKVDSKGNIIAGYMFYGDKIKAEIKKFTPDLKPLMKIASVPTVTQPPVIHYFENQRIINLHWDIIKDDSIIWGDISKYEFHVHSSEGKLIKRITTDYDGVKITEEDKKKYIKEMFGNNPVPSRITLVFPKNLPPFRQFTIDEEGRLFVRNYENVKDDKGVYYDVFDTDGKYLARIILKMIPRCWKNNKLYATGEDEEGNIVVKRYKVIWK